MADDELDSLYWVQPKDFTAERAKLTAAARRRGDETAAKRISAARKPTTTAWIANRLALRHKETTRRLKDLGEKLRDAHAVMDGARIRELSAEQHRLIGELTEAALDAADVRTPSSAVRDDLAGTLQAAIADPEVRARLGRLARPQRWSGFGTFGDAAPASTAARGKTSRDAPRPSRRQPAKKSPGDEAEKARQQREKLDTAVTEAERAKAEADDALSGRKTECDAASQNRDEALAALKAAEREFTGAKESYEQARLAARAAAESVKEAKARLNRM